MDKKYQKSNTISSKTSSVISWLRFPLVMMVLFIHVHPMDVAVNVGMQHLQGATWSQVLYTCWSIGLSLLLYILFQRLCPKVFGLLTGGR